MHLTGGDLVVDIGWHVKHLVMVQHGGAQAQTMSDLSGQDLKIFSKSPGGLHNVRGSLPTDAASWSE